MAGLTFQRAVKSRSKLRLALIGPSGSGKTYSALAMAATLGKRVAVIDTENGSAALYADRFGFDVLCLESFAPAKYIEAIKAAEEAGYDVIVIDSLSHAWMGKDGALEMVDNIAKRNKTANNFAAWRDVTPQHNQLVDAMIRSKSHVIVTMRSKTDYVQEKDERGKTIIRKVGLAPVQRDGLEYEFTVVGELDQEHTMVVTKSRCSALADAVVKMPGAQVAATLLAWLNDGAEPPTKSEPVADNRTPYERMCARLQDEYGTSAVTAANLELKGQHEGDVRRAPEELLRKVFKHVSRAFTDQAAKESAAAE